MRTLTRFSLYLFLIFIASPAVSFAQDPFHINEPSSDGLSNVTSKRMRDVESRLSSLQRQLEQQRIEQNRREQQGDNNPSESDGDGQSNDPDELLKNAKPFGHINGKFFVSSPEPGFRLIEVPESIYREAVSNSNKRLGSSDANNDTSPGEND